MKLDELPRHPLAHLPTPLEELPRMSAALDGPRLQIKRDDQTGLALGGNKARKLEFLLGDALKQGADTLLTAGAAQSNHCRQTAAAAAKAGLKCEVFLNGTPPDLPNGNLLLDHLLGVEIHWIPRAERAAKMNARAETLKAEGRKPYVIPVGGSNGIGAVGYVVAMLELNEQIKRQGLKVDHIVFGTSSGGTQAGMVAGARFVGFERGLHGIGIDKGDEDQGGYEAELAEIANETARYCEWDERFEPGDFTVVYGYKGAGYGVVGDLEREAIRMAARTEGILLDPVYAGRAFGALIDLIRKGEFRKDETVLFWHTGGAPALFGYVKDLMPGDCSA
jgi:D-cysteine desulfhydrase